MMITFPCSQAKKKRTLEYILRGVTREDGGSREGYEGGLCKRSCTRRQVKANNAKMP